MMPATDSRSGPSTASSNDDLTARIGGTLTGRIIQEFFSNSAHFPIANILFEMLRAGVVEYLLEPDFYAIVAAAVVQAIVLGRSYHLRCPIPFLGNLVGPALYTAIEVSAEGAAFFAGPHHLAYWGFALTIGVLQSGRLRAAGRTGDALLVAENVARASILVVMYWIFESLDNPKFATLAGFAADESHLFVAFVVPLLGLLLGIANIVDLRRLSVLRSTAHRLKDLSEWSMGAELVSRAVSDPEAMTLKRTERTILFMDIRGFTNWTEGQSPEAVVGMLNTYFEASERVWTRHPIIVARLIADAVMLVLPDSRDALRLADALRTEANAALRPFGLSTGIGLNTGMLIEGLIGCRATRAYDVIGDVANTASRLCSAAAGGEVLIRAETADALTDLAVFGEERVIVAKGKRDPIPVRPLDRLHGAP